MQYYSSAEIFTTTGSAELKSGPFVKITALQDSTININSGVIDGIKSTNANVFATL